MKLSGGVLEEILQHWIAMRTPSHGTVTKLLNDIHEKKIKFTQI